MKKILFFMTLLSFLLGHQPPAFAKLHFNKAKMLLDKTKLTVEVADTPERHARGLMSRTSMTDKQGMIFIFPDERTRSFWMRDTLIPLSIGFFDQNGVLFQILDMDPANVAELRPKIYISAKPAKYALEVAQGWFARRGVNLGVKFKIPHLKLP